MIVLDASAAVHLVLNSSVGQRVAERIAEPSQSLHAPHLVDLEVAQVLRRYVHLTEISVQRAQIALQDFIDLDVQRYDHHSFLDRIWQLRDNLTAYDAAYVALAEVLDAVLLTTDARLAGAPGDRVRIEVVSVETGL